MTILVTGSSGHLGEALVRTLRNFSQPVVGMDKVDSPLTSETGSVVNSAFVADCMKGVKVVFHTATLHKPHIATHSRQDFIDTNITGTLNLLEAAVRARVQSFIFTSTTSVFGHALTPPPGRPAAWITEDVVPIPKNIYGVTKATAEDLCELFHRQYHLACVVLRTSRFFPEEDDDETVRLAYHPDNVKINEFLYRRVELEDVVSAHLRAAERASSLGFRQYIISATTPFSPQDLAQLRIDAPGVVYGLVPEFIQEYGRRGWRMFPHIDRIYVNERARDELGWRPQWCFRRLIRQLRNDDALQSALAKLVGSKKYHR
jgi:nucleoside-diphosphate-sugar epimerase